MNLLQSMEPALASTLYLCRELVKTVNRPVQEGNGTCRIVASTVSLTC